MIPVVHFNSVSEFIAELAEDVLAIDGGIVRVTRQTARKGSFPVIHVSVIASAVVCPVQVKPDGQHRLPCTIVRLDRYCGDMFTTDELEDSPVWKKSSELMQKIEDAMREHGLSVRRGIVEAPNQQGS